jgi:hypothetical protein
MPAEDKRLRDSAARIANWKRWGPYLSERQWGTVREDYSPWGASWDYFTHDQARSRAYRWGEDGLLGFTDRECRLCFAVALWNGRDPILKERLFGLTNSQGNHGEDVKECYYYLDGTPTHSYCKALYKYPQAEFPYQRLEQENRQRGQAGREFELLETGIFAEDRYFDVEVEYAKAAPDDILVRVTVTNRGPDAATLHLLPTFWFRNTWVWGCRHEGCTTKPRIWQDDRPGLLAEHETLGKLRLFCGTASDGVAAPWLFAENESNFQRLFGAPQQSRACKDAFHEFVIGGNAAALAPKPVGTKVAAHFVLEIPSEGSVTVPLRWSSDDGAPDKPFDRKFDTVFRKRAVEADEFYASRMPASLSDDERRIMRQAYAGLLWSKQFYHYILEDWLNGDPEQPLPPPERRSGRNADWLHLYNRDVLSVPDKWEYPWFAAWDLAFHMLPFARIDGEFAKDQLQLLLREWYMHPNGQMPAYEFSLGDVNPPVHAWASWRVYKIAGGRKGRDKLFLRRVFQKLLLNFTWWVNRKDVRGKHLFSGGFLGLDNIGIFDRSQPLPTGGHLEQADGTAWMAFYCVTMLAMALELALDDPSYEDVASKFFEHFVAIADAINTLDGQGLWDELDGFYYDHLHMDGMNRPLRVRSMVGIIPLFAVYVLDQRVIDRLPGFRKRMEWFLKYRSDLAQMIAYFDECPRTGLPHGRRLLAIPSRERLQRMLKYILDESEFLSPYGVRSLSKVHERLPFTMQVGGVEHRVDYTPGESTSWMFGGNSNWRGPVWFPLNYLLIEALEAYHHFYGETLTVECPTGSGQQMTLLEVARELERRLTRLFLADERGRRPCHGDDADYTQNPHWKDLVLFYEYFHGDTGRGLGASHQTGWTALVAPMFSDLHDGHRVDRPKSPSRSA